MGVWGFCLSSYMELVMPVVAMLRGRGRRGGALRSRTGPPLLAAPPRPDMADPGRDVVVEFSRDRPGTVSKARDVCHSKSMYSIIILALISIYPHKKGMHWIGTDFA